MSKICRVNPIVIFFLSSCLSILSVSPTIADSKILDVFSDYDSYNPSGIDFNYDLQRVEVGLYASDSDRLVVWLHFRNPITRTMFLSSANGGSAPWALVSIWRNKPSTMGGNSQDFRLSTNGVTAYPLDNGGIAATASGNISSGGTRSDLGSCKPTTWSNVSEGAKWIGFGISRSCAKLPDSFYISGYVDPNTTNGDYSDFDYAPDSAFFVDLSNGLSVSPTPSPSRSTVSTVRKTLQTISVEKPYDVSTEDTYGQVYAYSSSGLPVRFESRSPSTCEYSYSEDSSAYFEILREGLCLIAIYQDGDDYYLAAPTQYTSFMISLAIPSPTPKPSLAKKSTPSPSPSKKIIGTVTTKQVSIPKKSATTSSNIGGSASTQKKSTPTPTPSKKK